MNSFLLSFLYLLLWPTSSIDTADECIGPNTPDDILEIINNSTNRYKKRTRPNLAKLLDDDPMANPSMSPPDAVNFTMRILSIKNVDQQRGEVELQILLVSRWNDYRLNFESSNHCYNQTVREAFDIEDLSSLWKPYFSIFNAVSKPKEIKANFWIYPSGDVELQTGLLLKIDCKLNFYKFPYDTQSCQVIVGTVIGTTKISFGFLSNAITKNMLDLVGGSSTEWIVGDLNAFITTYGVDELKPLAVFELELERNSRYYVDYVIVPVVMMVFVGWASFFIDRSSAPARVSMSTTGFLTISNFLSSELKNLPRLGPEDVWLLRFMQMSMAFSFYSVIEYVICNYLYRVEERINEVRKMAMNCNKPIVSKKDMIGIGICKIDRLLLSKDGMVVIKDQHVEIFSRYMYPVVYAICCVAIRQKSFQ